MTRQEIETIITELSLQPRPALSKAAEAFLSALRRSLIKVRGECLCVCPRCIEREVVSALAGFCAVRMTLDAEHATAQDMEPVFCELAGYLPYLTLDSVAARTEGADHRGN